MHRINFKKLSESRLVASKDLTGKVWEVMVIRAGFSMNRSPEGVPFYYRAEMLKNSLHLFENKPAYCFDFDEANFDPGHIPNAGDFIKRNAGIARNKVGVYNNPRMGTNLQGETGIVCDLTIVDAPLVGRMKNAWDSGIRDFVEYSIDGDGDYEIKTIDGKQAADVTLTEIDSIDLVKEGAAGGQNIRIAASSQTHTKDKRMNAKLKAALTSFFMNRKNNGSAVRLLEAVDEATSKTVAVEELKKESDAMQKAGGMDAAVALAKEALSYLEQGNMEAASASLQKLLDLQTQQPAQQSAAAEPAQAAKATTDISAASGGSAVPSDALKALQEEIRKMKEDSAKLKESLDDKDAFAMIGEANLPDVVKEHLKESVKGRTISPTRIKDAIDAEQKILEKLGVGKASQISLREGKADAVLALEGMFADKDLQDEKKRAVRKFRGLKEAMAKGWGIRAEELENPDRVLGVLAMNPYASNQGQTLKEGMTTASFDQVFASVMYRSMMEEYSLPMWQSYERISKKETVNDFRDHQKIRIGYWGEAPDVDPDSGTYSDAPDLSDEQVTLNVSTKGYIFSVTRKMVVNDDIQAIRTLPIKAARSLRMRQQRGVFDVLFNNATCGYDSVAIIATGHSNKGSSALSPITVSAGRSAMFKQTAFGSDSTNPEYLAELAYPKFIIGHPDKENDLLAICKSTFLPQLATASGAFPSGSYLDANAIPNVNYGLEPILNPRISNSGYFWLLADPNLVPAIIRVYLKGAEEPELTQEVSGSGSNFTAKVVRYCASHDFGVKVGDHRGAYGYIG